MARVTDSDPLDPIDRRVVIADSAALTERMRGLIHLLDDVAEPYREIQGARLAPIPTSCDPDETF